MNFLHRSLLGVFAVVTACGNDSPSGNDQEPPPPPENVTVAVRTNVQYQTMTGWQANAQAGQFEPGYSTWRDAALDRGAADGINRLRIDLRSGAENTRDAFTEWLTGAITDQQFRCLRYATVNDNASASSINTAGFKFSELDSTMARVVVPFRQRVQARGQALGITMTYVAFTGQICAGGQYVHTDPNEYAEFAVAAMTHMRDRWNIIPDTWELINEPDNTGGIWSPDRIRDALVALNQRLTQAGFQTRIVAPSHTNASTALSVAQTIMGSPAGPVVDEIGYHRYGGGDPSTVQSLGNLAKSHGISTAMTEHIASGYEDLIVDITMGRAATWEQFTLAFPGTDDGAHYYVVQGSSVITGSRTKYLRHYFRHVFRGAVRVDAESRSSSVSSAVAFRNTNGRVTVIMKYDSPGTITVGGLPAGQYGIGFESESTSDGTLPDVTVGSDGVATLQLQSRGVVALYGRS